MPLAARVATRSCSARSRAGARRRSPADQHPRARRRTRPTRSTATPPPAALARPSRSRGWSCAATAPCARTCFPSTRGPRRAPPRRGAAADARPRAAGGGPGHARGRVHWLEREGERTPLEETEFATRPQLRLLDARGSLDWAEERSEGYFPAADGREFGSAGCASRGAAAVVGRSAALAAAGRRPLCSLPTRSTRGRPCVIAAGLRRGLERATDVVVRCAPAFVGVLSGAGARSWSTCRAAGRRSSSSVGSHVPTSSASSAPRCARRPDSAGRARRRTPCRPRRGGAQRSSEAVERAAALLESERAGDRRYHARGRQRRRPRCEAGAAIASGLAAVVARPSRPRSASCSPRAASPRRSTCARACTRECAEVVGPLRDGISLWSVTPEEGAVPGRSSSPATSATPTTSPISSTQIGCRRGCDRRRFAELLAEPGRAGRARRLHLLRPRGRRAGSLARPSGATAR